MISLKCSYDTDIATKHKWLKAHHVLLEIITPMNVLATVVYWLVLSAKFNEKHKDKPFDLLHTAVVHSFPLIANVLNLMVTDVVFKMSHSLVLVPIAFTYASWNYYATVSTGRPVYFFLDWQDSTSFLICSGLTLAGILLFSAISLLT